MICAMRWCGAGFLLSVASGACYHGGEVCSNGQLMACEGEGGCAGQQVCQGDGSFGTCLCEVAPDDEESGSSGAGTTEPEGSSKGSGSSTGAPPLESGTGDPSDCVPLTCDSKPESYCGGDDDRCGHELVCPCPGSFACEKGECQPLCDLVSFTIWNDLPNEVNCQVDGPPLRSKMFVARGLKDIDDADYEENVVIDVLPGEEVTIEIACCIVANNECPGMDDDCSLGGKDFCACEYYDLQLMGDSCEAQAIKGCPVPP